jgi:hypothetical protein
MAAAMHAEEQALHASRVASTGELSNNATFGRRGRTDTTRNTGLAGRGWSYR